MKSYAIADCKRVPDEDFYERVAALARLGVPFLQLRAKSLDDRDFLTVATRVRKAVSEGATRFLVNSRADVAIAAGADGVHLPSRGLPIEVVRNLRPGLLVGRSCHDLEECRAAAAEKADYVLLGPVFAPRSKIAEGSVSLKDLREAARLGIPIFALGGISLANLEQFRGLPIQGLAGVTLFMKDEPLPAILDAVNDL